MQSLWRELKRRNVVRVAAAYLILAWLILQIADVILGNIGSPAWVFQVVLTLLALGLPMALFFAWVFEITPEGLKKESEVDRSRSIAQQTGRKLDVAIIALFAVAAAYVALDRFLLTPNRSDAPTAVESNTLASQPAATSIAVLPFVNMSADPENEYFADGISEEILNLLANVPELQVTSRSSAFSFKGQNLDVPTMAARLNVAHVLEGSVRKAGNRLRITAQLIRVASDTHLWSESYDRKLENVFEIQDEIAETVAAAMEVKLLGDVPKAPETDPEAYALYLQARQYLALFSPGAVRQAESLARQSLDIDPEYAPALTLLGEIYFAQTGVFGIHPYEDGMERARDAFEQALNVDPQYAPAHTGLHRIAMYYDFDFLAASEHLSRALALSPGSATIIGAAADLDWLLGRIESAIDLSRQALALDPLNGHEGLAVSLFIAGRYEEAVATASIGISLNPGRHRSQYVLSRMLMQKGDLDAALETIREEPSEVYRLTGLALIQHERGDKEAADAAFGELIERFADNAFYQIAENYAVRGDVDQAFDWLNRAYDARDTGLIFVSYDPAFSGLSDDPRWNAFLRKMGLPE